MLATQVAPTVAVLCPQGSRGVYIRAERMSFPSCVSDMLVVRIGQLTTGDLHPIRLAALSAAPPRLRDRPLRACHGRTPRRIPSPPCPKKRAGNGCCLQVKQDPRHPESISFGAASPWPTRSHAYASQNLFPGTAQGLLPARAGSPLAGRDLHPLDDMRSFMVVSHLLVPFDPQGLVALIDLSVVMTKASTIRRIPMSYRPRIRKWP